jgi:hypothetical protein
MEFATRADQLVFVMRRFLVLLSNQLKRASLDDMGIAEHVDVIPDLALIGKAVEIEKKYGEALKKRELTAVFRLIVDHAVDAAEPEKIYETAAGYVSLLEGSPEESDKLFIYTGLILDLLN